MGNGGFRARAARNTGVGRWWQGASRFRFKGDELDDDLVVVSARFEAVSVMQARTIWFHLVVARGMAGRWT
jgi:hypothetical protein